MELAIGLMKEDDLERVLMIENSAFSDPWSECSFRRELSGNPYSVYFTARVEGRVAGYIGCWIYNKNLHITNLAVAQEYTGRGIATELVKKILTLGRSRGVKQCTLEVRISNRKAVKLYKKLGFILQGRKNNYYRSNNEDALLMGKELEYEQGTER